jgi:hypothetical protein
MNASPTTSMYRRTKHRCLRAPPKKEQKGRYRYFSTSDMCGLRTLHSKRGMQAQPCPASWIRRISSVLGIVRQFPLLDGGRAEQSTLRLIDKRTHDGVDSGALEATGSWRWPCASRHTMDGVLDGLLTASEVLGHDIALIAMTQHFCMRLFSRRVPLGRGASSLHGTRDPVSSTSLQGTRHRAID